MAKTSIIREAGDILQEAQQHWKEPPEAQIPVGDSGWYTSPNLQSDKGVDPRNCEEWPDSPYCGGNPWTRTPAGFEFDYGVDACGAWVQATPVLGFTKLPPISVGYRQAGGCREEEKPPQPEPQPEDTSRSVSPLKFPKTINPEVNVFIVLLAKYTYTQLVTQHDIDNFGRIPPPINDVTIINHSLVDSLYPTSVLAESYFPNSSTGLQTLVPAIGKGVVQQTVMHYVSDYEIDPNSSASIPPLIKRERTTYETKNFTGWITSDHARPQIPNWKRYVQRELKGDYFIQNCSGPLFAEPIASVVIYGKLREIIKDWDGFVVDGGFTFRKGVNGAAFDGFYSAKQEWEIGYISIPDKEKQPPPPDAERKRKCCMQCCNGGSQIINRQSQDNAQILYLLRKIDRSTEEINRKIGNYPFNVVLFDADDNKVGAQPKTVSVASIARGQKLMVEREEKNAKSIGIDVFPMFLPSSNIQDESNGLLGDLGDLKNKIFKQRIESVGELLAWKIKADHEVFGQWQEVIEIQDSDPNVKGNQPKRIVLPNIAKTLREIILLIGILIKAQGFSMDAILKMYIDIIGTKTSVSVIEAVIRDVQDFLDYPTVTRILEVPVGVTTPDENDPTDDKEDIERFLTNSKVKVTFDDWTGEGSLHDMLLILLDMASKFINKPHT